MAGSSNQGAVEPMKSPACAGRGVLMICENCDTEMIDNRCPSCDLYDAAVVAQGMAAHEIATARFPGARNAWLNEHGIFAFVESCSVQVGTAEEAAPFAALTTACRAVHRKPKDERDGGECEFFDRGKPDGECEGDGHYECKECVSYHWRTA